MTLSHSKRTIKCASALCITAADELPVITRGSSPAAAKRAVHGRHEVYCPLI